MLLLLPAFVAVVDVLGAAIGVADIAMFLVCLIVGYLKYLSCCCGCLGLQGTFSLLRAAGPSELANLVVYSAMSAL